MIRINYIFWTSARGLYNFDAIAYCNKSYISIDRSNDIRSLTFYKL